MSGKNLYHESATVAKLFAEVWATIRPRDNDAAGYV